MDTTPQRPYSALIVGAGVAGLEAALCLREVAPTAVATTVLAPDDAYVDRPMSVREPFGRARASRFPVTDLLTDAGIAHARGALRWLDHRARQAHTTDGVTLGYDAILLALGARPYHRFPRALTIDPRRIDAQLRGIVADVEAGSITRLVFVIPPGRTWPLPAYELALMTAARAHEMGMAPQITLVTPEPVPLAVFGEAASAAVAAALADAEITLVSAAVAHVRAPGQVHIEDRARDLIADYVITLPELRGPGVAGVPATGLRGFMATDASGRVRHLPGVFAAGDITSFPVKQGGIAAAQAEAAARAIAALAGVEVPEAPFEPVVHGILLGPVRPLYLRARLIGAWPVSSEVSEVPLWDPADKIHAPRLTRALAGYHRLGSDLPLRPFSLSS
ncbi:FAD-dependent oxidoreductase [Conexibacter sp. DBS9H8]|uniref:FAD-dependent oxidoreductase n=1 Tax=Conexibacter sp. DBS9H8 TaxID=2937801 RepID=UPI00200EFF86|nr:FAD-dependent oxidoreductase [Conexibacter sp. DBS9H8]